MTLNQINFLEEQLFILDDKYDFNSGGCCFVAGLIAEELEKLNVDFKLTIFNRYYSLRKKIKAKEFRQNIKENIDYPGLGCGVCNHYVIYLPQFKKYLNIGGYTLSYYHTYTIKLSSEEIYSIYDNGYWNTQYRADKYNNVVRNKIVKLFKQLPNYE